MNINIMHIFIFEHNKTPSFKLGREIKFKLILLLLNLTLLHKAFYHFFINVIFHTVNSPRSITNN